ncbi:MAG: hypothetical protein ACLFUR_06440 [Candidatus Hadarchaeia archaeon]
MTNPHKLSSKENIPDLRFLFIGVILLMSSIVRWGFNTWNHNWTVGIAFLIPFVGFLGSQISKWRYDSMTKVSTREETYSISGPDDIYEAGKWLIFHVGGYKVGGIGTQEGGEGVIAVPRDRVEKEGNTWEIRVQDLEKTPLEEMPPNVRHKIENRDMEGPYRWGIFPPIRIDDEDYEIECPECKEVFTSEHRWVPIENDKGEKELLPVDRGLKKAINDIKPTLKDIDRQNAKREDAIRGDFDMVSEMADVSKDMQKKGIKEKITRSISRDEEEK